MTEVQYILMKQPIKYDHKKIELKWRERWTREKKFYKQEVQGEKLYLLFAFPYPSGAGLHVGHVESMVALDIMARYFRMRGRKVFFPIGWDSFGLPAENYAIKTGIPPEETTKKAIETFHRQIREVGISFNWDNELATSSPEYYRFTQWLFLELYKKGLAYKGRGKVNWCNSCQTVLANEQVVNGLCERCDSPVVQKEMEQWFFKITAYAQELLDDLAKVDWPRATLEQQRNWLGRKEGVVVTHKIDGMEEELETFSAFPAWMWADTYISIAPEHPLVKKLVEGTKYEKKIKEFLQGYKEISYKDRLEDKYEKNGVFTGRYALDPFNNNRKMPIWLANFVMMDFGTGVVRSSGHDIRDWEFAQKYGIEVNEVVDRVDPNMPANAHENKGVLKNSAQFSGSEITPELIAEMVDWMVEQRFTKRKITWHLRDWLISRQRYWGAPIPIVYDPQGLAHPVRNEHLPWLLPTDVEFKPTGESPLRGSKELKERVEKLYGKGWTPEYDTMDTFVDSSWYFLRYPDPHNKEVFASKESLKEWQPPDFYMIGPEHIVLHLLYARFLTKFLRDQKMLEFDEPFPKMRHQGIILGPDGKRMSKSRGNIINPDDVVAVYGADTLRLYEMFMGPIEMGNPWDVKGVQGPRRLIERLWRWINNKSEAGLSLRGRVVLAKTLVKVGADIEALKFNTAIASLMSMVNEIGGEELSREEKGVVVAMLYPFSPFVASELAENWEVDLSRWPKFEEVAVEPKVTIVVQVGGRVRAKVEVARESAKDKARVLEIVMASEQVKKWVEGEPKKIVFVPGRLVNLILHSSRLG